MRVISARNWGEAVDLDTLNFKISKPDWEAGFQLNNLGIGASKQAKVEVGPMSPLR